jgi:hypothetical protein
MCVLYFPGEKFPPKDELSTNAAYFLLEKAGSDNTIYYTAKVRLESGAKYGEGEFSTQGYIPVVEADDMFLAALAVGKAFLKAGNSFSASLCPGDISRVCVRSSERSFIWIKDTALTKSKGFSPTIMMFRRRRPSFP